MGAQYSVSMTSREPNPLELTRASERIAELRSEIHYHDYLYYNLSQPEIGDSQYDARLNELRELERDFPTLITKNSPTQRVSGTPSRGFAPVVHRQPMLSLGNVFNADDLRAWHRRAASVVGRTDFKMVCEPKIDGLAISLVYLNGELETGATRGDGTVGEDVTANLRTIRTLPTELWSKSKAQRKRTPMPKPKLGDEWRPAEVEVRGEVYMLKSEFERLNRERLAENQPLYMNARNTAAGSLRQLNPRVTAERRLNLFAYQLGWYAAYQTYLEGPPIGTHTEAMEWIAEAGFPTNALTESFSDIDDVADFCTSWASRRSSLDYDIDGVVVKIDDFALQRQLGIAGREPRWATAWKFPAEQATTRLLQIDVSVGRTGVLTPFAVLDPVIVGGARVSMATLHNAEHIRERDIRAGDYVVVQRAGDVIPQVVERQLSRREGDLAPFVMPQTCPVCGAPVMHAADEAAYYCRNRACPAQLARQVEHFASRGAMDIEGLGEKMAFTLVEKELIESVADLYELGATKIAELTALPGLGRTEKKERVPGPNLTRLLRNIEDSKTRPLWRVLVGLSIRHVGSETARALARRFQNMDTLLAAELPDLQAIPDIGPIVAESVFDFLHTDDNLEVLGKLSERGVRMVETELTLTEDGPLEGLSIVVTGLLDRWSRNEVETLIKGLGGKVTGAVSKSTAFVVAGPGGGSKRERAETLSIEILDEAAFVERLHEYGWRDEDSATT